MQTAGPCRVALGVAVLATGWRWRVADAAAPFKHGWGTASDLMGMHGTWRVKSPNSSALPDRKSIEFAAVNYAQITVGAPCAKGKINTTFTIEDAVLAVQTQIKGINPTVQTGMYWRTPFALELAVCSHFTAEWLAHPEWRLLDDAGDPVMQANAYFIDYSNPTVVAFVARVVLQMLTPLLPGSTRPVLDYVYLDGNFNHDDSIPYAKGVGPQRTAALNDGKVAMVRTVQAQLDAWGAGQQLVLNGMDDAKGAAGHVATGVSGHMFDHWSILQFLDPQTGQFIAPLMDDGIALAQSALLSNVTTQIKGWPGPIIKQRDMYPPTLRSPNTTADFQAIAAARFNSELALFLLVATELDFWTYSWFWGWYDYIPGDAESTVPPDFFPEAACPLGPPKGPGKRVDGTWRYTREFEHASVFVDLTNRTACRVAFTGCNL